MEMTLEELIRIIIEAVDSAMALQRLRVGVCLFDAANLSKVQEAAGCIGGKGPLLDMETAAGMPCDVIFTDAPPVGHFAKLALGIIDSNPAKYLHEAIMNGGTVFVLGDAPAALQKTPPACAALLQKYKTMLEAYGYVFLGAGDTFQETPGSGGTEAGCFDLRGKKVIGRGDIAALPRGGRVLADGSALITNLAADVARDKKIAIKRY